MLDLGKFAEYLSTRRWVEVPTSGRGHVRLFDRPEPENRLVQIRIPKTSDLADYDDVMARSLSMLARFEKADVKTVYGNLLFYSDDRILLREDTADTMTGTISIARATEVFASIKKSLLSSAHSEISPRRHYPRLDRVDADNFLDKCRFGQTGPGSYIMTVICPLNAVPEFANPEQSNLFSPYFTRRVTLRMMGAMRVLVDAAQRAEMTLALHDEITNHQISANLCDALVEMSPQELSGKLDVSFNWAKKQPYSADYESPTIVTLKNEYITFIESISAHLRVDDRQELRQMFYGRIDTLDGRPNEEGRMCGPVYSRMTDQNNDRIKVRIDLDVEQYRVAVDAHGAGSLVVVYGILRRVGAGGLRVDDHDGLQIVQSAPLR